jgi:hypothetical protein
MASTEQTIVFINHIISVYVGFFIIITGFIGNIINILVFTQLKLFRRNQSAFYLTVAPIVDCCQLIFTTCIRVIAAAFSFDPTQTSLIWCKLRIYLAQCGATISLATVCFAAIDQYLSTSYHNRLRQISTFKLAQRLIGILIIFTALYAIPFPIFQEIRPSSGCATYNPTFNYFYSFVHLCIILGILPIVVSSFFSLLAYQNVRRITRRQMPIVRRRLDRQLTAMILVRVALFVITTSPFVGSRIYEINNSVDENNNSYSIAIQQLIKTTFIALYNINYTVFDIFVFDFVILFLVFRVVFMFF